MMERWWIYVSSDDEFDLDLSNFEANQKQAYLGLDAPDREEIGGVEAPWADERSFEQLYSPEVLWKARLLLAGMKVAPITDDELRPAREHKKWSVDGSQPYVVQILESEGMDVPWALCSCPNGEARGGRPSCYHTAAVLALILDKDLSDVPEPVKKKRST